MFIRDEEHSERYLPLRSLDWRVVIGLVALNTLCLFSYRQLDYVAYANHRPALLTFLEEATGGIAGLAVFPLVYQTAIKFPLLTARWRLHLIVHLLAVCLISVLHTTIIAVLRIVLLPLFGFGDESNAYLPARYGMEFSNFFIYYWVFVALVYLFHGVRFARDREVRQAKLESNLAEAQLQNLRLQLEPHFLFNALNAISATLYEDVRAADEMIGRLGELLRQLLKEDHSQYVPLSREIELLQLYTRIMQARMEDRLIVNIDAEESVQAALVPQLILQPLVENAFRHGMDSRFEVSIGIRAKQDGHSLHLSVRDHGPGIDQSAPPRRGIGLRNTAERLQRLYGTNQSFEIRNAPEGGALVEICLPLQLSDHAQKTASLPTLIERSDS